MKATIDVSIIIVNYNTLQLTENCIKSVINKTSGCSYEIIVVDNGSTDGSKKHFENDPNITYIYSTENLGFGRANNLGAKHATGTYLFFLNSDTQLLNNAIFILKQFLDKTPDVYFAGAQLFDRNHNKGHSYRNLFPGIKWELNTLLNGAIEKYGSAYSIFANTPFRVSYITGADLMMRRNYESQLGLFSDKYFMYYEETDMIYRYSRYLLNSYIVPNALILHFEGESNKISADKLKMVYSSRNTYYNEHVSPFTKTICNIIFGATHISHFVLNLFNGRQRIYWKESWYAFMGSIK